MGAPEWLKDFKVLLTISVLLNAVLVAVIASNGTITTPWFTIAHFGLSDHIERLFKDKRNLPSVRAMLEEKNFYEISADNPGTEAIERALTQVAELLSTHALVLRLREMSQHRKGPFKPRERQAELVAKNDVDGLSEGIAEVCLRSGFEDMHLTIWGSAQRGEPMVTVHAAIEKECQEKNLRVVGLHMQDWKKLFDESPNQREESVLVGLRPPRITLPRPRRRTLRRNESNQSRQP